MFRAFSFAVCVLFSAGFSAFAVDNWASFQNGGNLELSTKAPLRWSPKEGVAWSKNLAGYGQSAPIIWKDHIYITWCAGANKEELMVQALNLKTGESIWKQKVANSSPQESTNYVSKAAPTPVADKQGVIAFFEGGNLIALTHEGKTRWQRDLVKDYGKIESRHGLASSLEQNDEHVFVWVERAETPYLLAVSKKTGETVWKSAGLAVTSWSSPRLVPVGSSHHLVLSGSGKIAGYDPKTGQRLWAMEEISNNSTPTPIPLGDGKFLIGASEGRGSQTSSPARSNGVIQISKKDDGEFIAEFVWTAKKATSSFGSPIAANGNAYFVNRTGVLFCLDLKTGEQKYAERIAGSIWATPIQSPKGIYFFGKDGQTTVVDSGDEFKVLVENAIWQQAKGKETPSFGGPVLYAASFAGGRLVLRRGDQVYCVGEAE